MKAALVTTWSQPKAGHEADAIKFAREVDDYWGKLAAEGKCSEPTWFWAMKGQSIWFVEGEYETLVALMVDPNTMLLQAKGSMFVEDFGTEICAVGRESLLQPYEYVMKEVVGV